MKRFLFGVLFSLWAQVAAAGVSCTLPFTLLNGTTADATQVMANYNALVACLGNAATAGANTDITSLLGLTTPLAFAEGGTQWFVGGTSTGTPNAQAVTTLTPGNFSLTPGVFVTFVAGFSNTGATTWNINNRGVTPVLVRSAGGLIPLGGGEIIANEVTYGFYDGTQFQLLDPAPTSSVQPCTVIDYVGVTVPNGYLTADGTTRTRASFPNLFACIAVSGVAATTSSGSMSVAVPNSALFQIGWFVGGNNVTCNSAITGIPDGGHITISNNAGGNGATTLTIGPYLQGDCLTTFNLPDLRGRATAAADTGGSVLTSTTCAQPASIGSNCGTQTKTLVTANLPPYTPSGTITQSGSGLFAFQNNGGSIVAGGGIQGPTGTVNLFSIGQNFTGNAQGGTSTPVSSLAPVGLTLKAIKF